MLGLFWFGLGVAHAATPLNGAWREARAGDTPQSVLHEYQAGLLKSFDPSLLQRFPKNSSGSWVVITPQPPWDNTARVLTIYPLTLGTVTVFGSDQPQTLALDDFSASTHGHGRLAWPLPASMAASAPILLKFEPSQTLSAPVRFHLESWNEYMRADAQWLVFASACFAVMLAMVLMALCFALMLRDVTYAWYAGYILCYTLIQGIQTGFVFHPMEWELLSGTALLAGSAAVALSVAFASLFMMRFCELQSYAPLLRVPIMALAVGMIQLVLMRSSRVPLLVEVAQILLNPLLMIGAALLLVAAIVAAARGSRQAWFFLAGWTPLLLLTALTAPRLAARCHSWTGSMTPAWPAVRSRRSCCRSAWPTVRSGCATTATSCGCWPTTTRSPTCSTAAPGPNAPARCCPAGRRGRSRCCSSTWIISSC
ncbi:MAG TPA: 7TM-DISM domain-containing protein [Rhodanobacter sp.]|nr:7TM-DISM domain-containing protein [Rhodanobacter sp.]